MIRPLMKVNDRKARWIIGIFSVIVFIVITFLGRVQLDVDLPFDVHLFAKFNAMINTAVSVLLLGALFAVKIKRYDWHQRLMMVALALSVAFLISYIGHHLFAGDTRFGDANLDGVVDEAEKAAVGAKRIFYLIILLTHIFLAAIILPLVLFTAYRALTAQFEKHKKLARITWPIWFYVAVSGPVIYAMISPYYG